MDTVVSLSIARHDEELFEAYTSERSPTWSFIFLRTGRVVFIDLQNIL